MPKVKVIVTARHKAPLFLTKAKQFCESAVQQLQDGRFDSTVLCAVHAGISTADAVCIGIGGRRSGDPNHLVAAALLEEVGRNSSEYRTKANQLRALIKPEEPRRVRRQTRQSQRCAGRRGPLRATGALGDARIDRGEAHHTDIGTRVPTYSARALHHCAERSAGCDSTSRLARPWCLPRPDCHDFRRSSPVTSGTTSRLSIMLQ